MVDPVQAKTKLDTYVGSEHGPALQHFSRPISESHLLSAYKVKDDMGNNKISHTFFKGGKAYVTDDALEHMMMLYAIDVLNHTAGVNKLTHMIERANPNFPLFMDIDFHVQNLGQQDAQEDQIQKYWQTLCKVVRRFYPDEPKDRDTFNMIVCTRQIVQKPENMGFKLGWHLHWPKLIVDANIALYIRELAVCTFIDQFKERCGVGCNKWSDVFDTSVYIKGGLRVMGSHKRSSDSKYKVEHDSYGEPVTYWPHIALTGDGTTDHETQQMIDEAFPMQNGYRKPRNTFDISHLSRIDRGSPELRYIAQVMDLALRVRIRLPIGTDVTSGFTVFEGAPTPGRALDTGLGTHLKVKLAEQSVPRRKGQFIPANQSELCVEVQQYLRRLTEFDGTPLWPEIVVKSPIKVSRKPGRGKYGPTVDLLVSVGGVGSRKCLNIANRKTGRRGGDHKSNHIWFLITDQGVNQRCYCTKQTVLGRYSDRTCPAQPCNGFSSQFHCRDAIHRYRLPESLKVMMDKLRVSSNVSETSLFAGPMPADSARPGKRPRGNPAPTDPMEMLKAGEAAMLDVASGQ